MILLFLKNTINASKTTELNIHIHTAYGSLKLPLLYQIAGAMASAVFDTFSQTSTFFNKNVAVFVNMLYC